MRKLLIFFMILLFACGPSEEETVPTTTTTTTNPNLRALKIAVYDDSVNEKYELVKVRITSPDKYTWSPDLEYGADSVLISKFEIGQIGSFTLVYDFEENQIPICFSPTEESKGDMGTIYIVLNDNDIEIDGLAVQDLVINRKTGKIRVLDDSSKPDC
jgi:hypothetical protein